MYMYIYIRINTGITYLLLVVYNCQVEGFINRGGRGVAMVRAGFRIRDQQSKGILDPYSVDVRDYGGEAKEGWGWRQGVGWCRRSCMGIGRVS